MDAREALDERLRLIEAAARSYDEGRRDEASAIAASLRAILHSTPSEPSLIGRLKAPFVELTTTAAKKPARVSNGGWPSLARADLDTREMVFVARPILDETKPSRRSVAFAYWWESEPVYEFGHKKVRRRDLTLALADPPADPAATAARIGIVGASAWRVTITPAGAPARDVLVEHGAAASIRQIAHEVLHSPALLKLAGR